MRILLVGEGNLTFAYALIKKLSKSKCFGRYHAHAHEEATSHGDGSVIGLESLEKPTVTVVVTTFDSKDELTQKYPETIPIFHYFSEKTRIRIIYKDCVDATRIAESLSQREHAAASDHGHCDKDYEGGCEGGFDLIFFNNPHTGKEDLFLQHCLLAHFFASARQVLRRSVSKDAPPSQVVVSLCDEQPIRWGLLQAAARSGFACVAAVPFTSAEFPEFDNKRHQNDAKFPFQQMTHFYFVQVVQEGEESIAAKRALAELLDVVKGQTHHGATSSAWEMWRALGKHFAAESHTACAKLMSPRSMRKLLNLSKEDIALVRRDGAQWGKKHISCCMPLLHPLLSYYYVSPRTESVNQCDAHATQPRTHECYSPLLPVGQLAALLLLEEDLLAVETDPQLALSEREEMDSTTAPPPAHLDSALLGRALTAKEEAKLQRYRAKFQSAATGCAKNETKESATTYVLPFLTSPVAFVEALQRDQSSNASYCSCCGTDFETADRFAQHMGSLTPLEDRFTCPLCPDRKPFKTERALYQHQARAHGEVPE